MDRWTMKELKEIDSITFAIRIMQERQKNISPLAPLAQKIAAAIKALEAFKHEADALEALKGEITDLSSCDDDIKSKILENAAKLEEREKSRLNFHGKQFNQDVAAHQTFAFATDERNVTHAVEGEYCVHCGGRLQTYYCEEKLYIVRCNECSIAALVKARNPSEAASRTIGGQGNG